MSTQSEDGNRKCAKSHPPLVIRIPEGAVLEGAAALFKILGDTGRLKILATLSESETCVTELAAAHGEQLSTVSQRLRMLKAAGLISRRREGRHIFYGVCDHHLAEIIRSALQHAQESLPGRPRHDAQV